MPPNTISSSDFVRMGRALHERLTEAARQLDAARSEHRRRIEALDDDRLRALEELVQNYLPDLTPEAFERVRSRAGYGRFQMEDPFAQMERRRASLQETIRTVEANPLYLRRDELLHPVTGELTMRAEELGKELQIFTDQLSRYEGDYQFRHLVAEKYETDEYRIPWWRWRYYRNWQWADLVTDRFGRERFSSVREDYLHLKRATHAQQELVAEVQRSIAEVQKLVSDRESAVAALATLREDTLASCRRLLSEHLEHIDREDLARWAGGELSCIALIKRIHGVERKIEYLEQMASRQFDRELELLRTRQIKLRKKIDKYSRSKYAYTQLNRAEVEGWLNDPSSKLAERRQRFRRDYDRIDSFDDYDGYNYAADLLWWDVMSDGRIDGDFIPEVQAWRAEHPEVADGIDSDRTRAGAAYSDREENDWSNSLEVS